MTSGQRSDGGTIYTCIIVAGLEPSCSLQYQGRLSRPTKKLFLFFHKQMLYCCAPGDEQAGSGEGNRDELH